MNIILSRISKILLKMFFLFPLIILFTFSEQVGFPLLIIAGIFAFVCSIFFANDIKKSNNSYKAITVVLLYSIFYSSLFLSYGLSNIGTGEKGGVFIIISLIYLILLVLSSIEGIILVTREQNSTSGGNPNKKLAIILFVILAILFYSTFVSNIARMTQNPDLCSMHVGVKTKSFIFNKEMRGLCIKKIAKDTLNVSYCNKIKPTDILYPDTSIRSLCFFNLADTLKDKNICYQINDSFREICTFSFENTNPKELVD